MKRSTWYKLILMVITLPFTVSVIILSDANNMRIVEVLSKIIIFFGKGLAGVFFTPYLLLFILLLAILINPNGFITFTKKLANNFEELSLSGIRFRPQPEETLLTSEIDVSPHSNNIKWTPLSRHEFFIFKVGCRTRISTIRQPEDLARLYKDDPPLFFVRKPSSRLFLLLRG